MFDGFWHFTGFAGKLRSAGKKKKKELRQNSLNVVPDRRHSTKYAKHSCCTVLPLSDYNSFFIYEVLFVCFVFVAPFSQLASSGTCSSSRTQISDTGSVETVIEARPVGNRAGLHSSGTIIEAKPVAEVLDTVIEAQPVIEDENSHKVHETLAATQVRGFFKALFIIAYLRWKIGRNECKFQHNW